MINLKKLLTNILTTLNSKVNRSGDIMSGDVTVAIPDGSAAASVGARCGTAADPTSWAVLQASTPGNAGVYDNKHRKWVARTDSDGKHHIPLSLTVLNTQKVTATRVGTAYTYKSIPNIINWNVIAIHVTVHENAQVLYFVRGEAHDRMLTDWPAAGKFRGTISVDWANSRILFRCINAGAQNNYINLVYFDYVYGVL